VPNCGWQMSLVLGSGELVGLELELVLISRLGLGYQTNNKL